MEEELKCPVCKHIFLNPVLLPCYHAMCLNCAINLQITNNNLQNTVSTITTTTNSSNNTNASSTTSSLIMERAESITSATSTNSSGSTSTSDHTDFLDVDKLSILSETDSGVICCTSRPNSFISPLILNQNTNSINNTSPPPTTIISLTCPLCQKTIFFDENGSLNLPKYKLMHSVIEKYQHTKQISLKCQMCVEEPAKEAIIKCDQCQVLYCEKCRESCHPSRGPLAKHIMYDPKKVQSLNPNDKDKCYEHSDELLTKYCLNCKISICNICLVENLHHRNHEIQSLAVICKSQKTELSKHLQKLSEKARSTTEFIQRLKGMSDKICVNCTEFEKIISAQCDALIDALIKRRDQLLEFIRQDKELRIRTLRDQVTSCTNHLQNTTGLLQFCIEALKENDCSAFLQVGLMLISRVDENDISWNQNLQAISPRVFPSFDLTLDDKSLMKAIDQLNFIQMKPPAAPIIIPDECNAENNSVTVAWRPPKHSHIEGYVLELDDGNGGEFREVYCGMETICTVDGLHFNSMYNARVKAFNSTGEGEYSDLVGLQTSEYAWFTFDPVLSATGLQFSADNLTVTNNGWEHCIALGSVGFSRGIHYWEYSLDKFDHDTDPAFGIARIDVNRTKMLGKDEKGWAMYIDRQRSWFQHCGIHEKRIEGGVCEKGTVGVLLDLNHHTLSFYVNDEPQGGIAFRDLFGVFYPAVSINRGVRLILHTSLEIPSDVEIL